MIEVTVPGRADELVEALPMTGLDGTAYDSDTVWITDLRGSDPDDVCFELEQYADLLGITNTRIVPAGKHPVSASPRPIRPVPFKGPLGLRDLPVEIELGNVIQFERPESGWRGLTCSCGSAWFDAVVVIEGGSVTGYSLPVKCHECGKETWQ